jgi:hypothetical protein
MGLPKCPECGVFAEFVAMGPYRVQCTNCDAIVKNVEIIFEQKEK